MSLHKNKLCLPLNKIWAQFLTVVTFKEGLLTVTFTAKCVTDLGAGKPRKSASIPGRCKNFSFLLQCRGRF